MKRIVSLPILSALALIPILALSTLALIPILALAGCAYKVPPAVTAYMDRGGNQHITLLDSALADHKIDQVTHDAEVAEIKAIQNLVKEAGK